MENFVFQNATKIIFGKGTEAKTARKPPRWARKSSSITAVEASKRQASTTGSKPPSARPVCEAMELGGVQPNPRLSLVQEGIRLCREKKVTAILAVGGGSVIDSAKAIAIGVPYAGDVWDFYLKKAPVKESLPVGVVLTIPAAGSESSNGSVITSEKGQYKKDAGGECMRPRSPS